MAMSSSWSYRTFGVLSALSVLIWWNALLTTFRLASTKDVCTHILLILPISVALVLLERKRQEWKPKPAVGGGLVMLLLAVLIGVGGAQFIQQRPTRVDRDARPCLVVAWVFCSLLRRSHLPQLRFSASVPPLAGSASPSLC